MSTRFRLALAQHDFPVGAVAANAAKVGDLLSAAKAQGADLVLFPELAVSGYPPQDLLLRPSFLVACADEVNALAGATHGIAAVVGFPECVGETVHDAAALLQGGVIDAIARKQVLPNFGAFDEKRYFQRGERSTVAEVAGVRVGILICADAWQPGPAHQAAADGAELLVVINASPWDHSRLAARINRLSARAKETGCAIAYLNTVGGQDELVFDGASLLINADGTVAARAPSFSDALLLAEFDPATRTLHAEDWPEPRGTSTEATLYAALVRGTRDYVEKNGFPGVLLGLSGGIDSALTLAIAVDALGAERVTAVMMPTRFTSGVSLDGARAQAESLGVAYHVIDIEAIQQAFLGALAPAFAGRPVDSAEENLQARTRGTLLMALSNKFGRMLLATGNKSEVAVGYCTLYGDTCGAYAPLKDVYKTTVYRLARWRNGVDAGAGFAPLASGGLPIPEAVITRAPSAELREGQTDQDSLPPYEVLDAILERFIEREESQADIVAAGYASDVVHRVARLVLGAEFKRQQGAPGPSVTTRAFGHGRRYPITSGWR